jgi:hypothetical protein
MGQGAFSGTFGFDNSLEADGEVGHFAQAKER